MTSMYTPLRPPSPPVSSGLSHPVVLRFLRHLAAIAAGIVAIVAHPSLGGLTSATLAASGGAVLAIEALVGRVATLRPGPGPGLGT